jgi:hypothetical protein
MATRSRGEYVRVALSPPARIFWLEQPLVVGHAAGVVEQLAQGDLVAVGEDAGQPALDSVVERELALADELQRDGRDENLVLLPMRKRSVGRIARPLSVSATPAAWSSTRRPSLTSEITPGAPASTTPRSRDGNVGVTGAPHWAALGRGMVATENLTNLGELPTRGAFFVFLSHKFHGATGGLVTCSPAALTDQAAGIRWVCPSSFQVAATSSGVR